MVSVRNEDNLSTLDRLYSDGIGEVVHYYDRHSSESDKHFDCAARLHMPELLDYIDKLETENARLDCHIKEIGSLHEPRPSEGD